MSSIAAEVPLIVAAFDLFATRAVTGAIRAADLESGDVTTPSGIIEKPEPAPIPTPNQDRFESSQQVQPQALRSRQPLFYAPRRAGHQPSHHSLNIPLRRRACCAPCDVAPHPVSVSSNPIEPPWKVLPWMDRAPRRVVIVREIKLVPAGSDMSLRGKMIDVVI